MNYQSIKRLLPLQGTDVAVSYDTLFIAVSLVSLFFFILVIFGMIYFLFKYRERPGIKTQYITDDHQLEMFWTAIPTVILLVFFTWGYYVYRKMVIAPPNAFEVRVIGKQWLWQFIYPNGKTTINELFVPAHQPIKMVMTSDDVLHSFFVPNFRVKQDVVPGMYTSVWFNANMEGKHQVYCAEYCGGAHSGMLAKVIALSAADWSDWYAGKKLATEFQDFGPGETTSARIASNVVSDASSAIAVNGGKAGKVEEHPTLSLTERGHQLAQSKGCVSCHSLDGTSSTTTVGPKLVGLFNTNVTLADDSVVIADENYLRESIEYPARKVVKGFQAMMPTYKGQMDEMELTAIISYIKSIKGSEQGGEAVSKNP